MLGVHHGSQLPRGPVGQGKPHDIPRSRPPAESRLECLTRYFEQPESPREFLRPWPHDVRPRHGQVLHLQACQGRQPGAENRHVPDGRVIANETRSRCEEGCQREYQAVEGHWLVPRTKTRDGFAGARSKDTDTDGYGEEA
jgi:hypothetical protein